mmetsp:Transcript_10771/g.17529  ORF Transcript_10771/g.17529 Transcript_10771/m.17529 type:complete len:153 (-) Transcript_10771:310-768(-)|eukprot:CAMPEP_0201876100 /NCGR_PEP_ID=MMETSP0902-20130614/7885_1 /ASSEMBLY_ACC=CAM_ASM_000551 /TAXON_ID=420261 /ORGANISM="Thalassiosira antarctica, Strain CCMP982" /LENGTH=152 /DNA_ID=CAMNT_0048403285 /DNA_START=33 /DNA_END=491 /DNA_ORIENTATION=+
MKNELFFLAKMAVVLTVVDSLIPRAETLAKSKMNHHNRSQQATSKHSDNEIPRYHPKQPLTEMHMGLFDMNPFHGSGSGGTKEALDEQWEAQQEILRARRCEDSHHVKKRKVESPKIEIKSVKGGTKVNHVDVDDTAHNHKSTPKFFWDLGK